jgi:hypothetical protein
MLGLFWALIFHISAQELIESSIDPRTLLLDKLQTEEDVALIEETLQRYAKASRSVVVAEIVTMRNVQSNLGQDREAEVIVEKWLRGEGDIGQTIYVPYNAPFIEEQWNTVPGKVVRGYPVLIFLDNQGRVLEGNAIFFFDGTYVWRNKRPTLFLNPTYDREWVTQNPYDDYVVIPITRVEYWLAAQKAASWIRF